MAGNIQGVEVFDSTMRNLISERIDQDFNKFNAASNGTMLLNGTTTAGDYDIDSFIKNITATAHYRRDITSTGTVTAAAYTEDDIVKVKVAGGFYVEVPDAVLMWATTGTAPDAEISRALSAMAEQYSEKYLQDQFNTSVAALGAAIEANTAMTNDQSGTPGNTIDQLFLNETRWLMGDRASSLRAWVMHSAAYSALIGDAISNANALDTVGGVAINNGVVQAGGLPIVISDDPALSYNNGSVDVYKILGLQAGASMVTQVKQISTTFRPTGNENIKTEWQANYDFDLGVKGYSWNITNGGRSPDDATIATGTNWDKKVTSDKDTAGVCLIVPVV